MRFRLVAFADEAAPDLAGQIEAMQENGVELLEIRALTDRTSTAYPPQKQRSYERCSAFRGLLSGRLALPSAR